MRGFFIKHLRRRMNWTQVELAEKSGLAQNTISKCETSAVLPKYATVIALAKALRVDPRALRFGPPPIYIPEDVAPTRRSPNRPEIPKLPQPLPKWRRLPEPAPYVPDVPDEDDPHVEK
jgi:transcriptional regulator with XRE-family HTH domain